MLRNLLWTAAAGAQAPSQAVRRLARSVPSPLGTPAARPARAPRVHGSPSPWLVLGAAFALGVLAAKTLEWRGDAHPHG